MAKDTQFAPKSVDIYLWDRIREQGAVGNLSLEELAEKLKQLGEGGILSEKKPRRFIEGSIIFREQQIPGIPSLRTAIGYRCNTCKTVYLGKPFPSHYSTIGFLSDKNGHLYACEEGHTIYTVDTVQS